MDFFFKYKKIFLIIGFIAVVILLGYMLYALFFKPAKPITPEQPTATTTPGGLPVSPEGGERLPTIIGEGGLPITPEGAVITEGPPSEVARGGLTKATGLNDSPSAGITLSSDGSSLQYYNKNDGKFYRIDKDGEAVALSDKVFHSVDKITWSSDKNKAILEYPDGANIVYDFSSNNQTTLPPHWKDFDFSPQGNQIVMKSMGLDPNNRWLAVVNEDGSKARIIESLGSKDSTVYPSWSPNNQSIAMYTEGVDFDRQEVFFVGLNGENFKSTVVEGRGFQPKWNPNGEQLLYSVYSSKDDMKPNLWVVNANGENIGTDRKSLNIETWADKCTFANENELYCAVPNNLEKGSGLFPELANNTTDTLYKIDMRSGTKKMIAVPDGQYNMSSMVVSENGFNLYFTDKNSGRLYTIKLK